MKWSTFESEVPPGPVRLAPKRRAAPPVPPWVMGVIAIVLTLIVCGVAYVFFSGANRTTPAPGTGTGGPTTVATIGTTPAAITSAAVLAPTAVTPFRLPPVVTNTAVPPTPSLCDTRTAETRYVSDSNGVYAFDSPKEGGNTLGLIAFRTAVQTFGTVEGRLSSNSNKWFVVRYNNRCAFVWADAKESRLSTTRPK